jgi:hypothetical protein
MSDKSRYFPIFTANAAKMSNSATKIAAAKKARNTPLFSIFSDEASDNKAKKKATMRRSAANLVKEDNHNVSGAGNKRNYGESDHNNDLEDNNDASFVPDEDPNKYKMFPCPTCTYLLPSMADEVRRHFAMTHHADELRSIRYYRMDGSCRECDDTPDDTPGNTRARHAGVGHRIVDGLLTAAEKEALDIVTAATRTQPMRATKNIPYIFNDDDDDEYAWTKITYAAKQKATMRNSWPTDKKANSKYNHPDDKLAPIVTAATRTQPMRATKKRSAAEDRKAMYNTAAATKMKKKSIPPAAAGNTKMTKTRTLLSPCPTCGNCMECGAPPDDSREYFRARARSDRRLDALLEQDQKEAMENLQ